MKPKPSAFGVGCAVGGACLLVLDLVSAARALAPAVAGFWAHGLADPSLAGSAVGELLVTVAVRGAFALPALLLLTFALVGARYRARWFFWFIGIASIAVLPLFPIGTGFAIFFLGYALRRIAEFGTAV